MLAIPTPTALLTLFMEKGSDELWYLRKKHAAKDFTVPELRSILLKHQIDYPSNLLKPQLYERYEQMLFPKAQMIISRTENVKRSSRGIINCTFNKNVSRKSRDRNP
jgi:hypothetical protein